MNEEKKKITGKFSMGALKIVLIRTQTVSKYEPKSHDTRVRGSK